MKHRVVGIALVLALSASPCPAQTSCPAAPLTGEITTVRHTLLPVIINGTQPKPSATANQAGGGAVANGASPAVPDKPGDLIENVVPFDPDQLQVEWTEGAWQLRCGGELIRDFGRNENAARLMLLLLRQLRVNQYGSVGDPKPILEYWLSNGQAPQGFASSLRLSPLDQLTLHVEKNYGQWCLRDAYRMLFSFERNEEDANRALAILRKYQFTQVGIVSSSNPPVLLFLTRPGDALEAARPGQNQAQLTANGPLAASPGLPAPGSFPGQPGLQTGGMFAPTLNPSLTMPNKPQAGAGLPR